MQLKYFIKQQIQYNTKIHNQNKMSCEKNTDKFLQMEQISQRNFQSESQGFEKKYELDLRLTGLENKLNIHHLCQQDQNKQLSHLCRQMLDKKQPQILENSQAYANVGFDLDFQQQLGNKNNQQQFQQQQQVQCQQNGDQNYKRIEPIKKQIEKKEKNKKLHKNNNVIKHFLKSFIYKCLLKRYIGHFDGFPEVLRQVNSFIKQEKKMYETNRNWNISLEAMRKVFGVNHDCSQFAVERSRILRKIAHEMIRKQIIPQVLTNNQIKGMAYSYIYSLIFMMHRCTNPKLMVRSQII